MQTVCAPNGSFADCGASLQMSFKELRKLRLQELYRTWNFWAVKVDNVLEHKDA